MRIPLENGFWKMLPKKTLKNTLLRFPQILKLQKNLELLRKTFSRCGIGLADVFRYGALLGFPFVVRWDTPILKLCCREPIKWTTILKTPNSKKIFLLYLPYYQFGTTIFLKQKVKL